MRHFVIAGSGVLGLLGLVACGDDGGTGGGSAGGSGQGGASSSSSSSSSSSISSSSSSSSGGGSTSDGGGGGGLGGGGGAGGGVTADVWAYAANEAGEEGVYDVEETPDGGVLVYGYFTGTANWGGADVTSLGAADLALVKYDADGAHVFTKRFGGTGNDLPSKVAVGPAGEILLTGSVGNDVDFGGGVLDVQGNADAFLVKLDADGDHVWSKIFGSSSSSDGGFSVAVNADGTVALTGQFGGTVDFGLGNVVATNTVDGFVAAFEPDGSILFVEPFSDGEVPNPRGVALDDDGNTYVAGYFTGTLDLGSLVSAGMQDIFLAKLDSAGAVVWTDSFGGTGSEFGSYLTLDSAGNVVMTGNLSGSADFGGGLLTTAGNADGFVARFDADGDHVSSMRFGDADDQFVSDIEAGANGAILLSGWLGGSFTVGSITIAGNGGGQDGYWLLLDSANAAVDGTAYVNGNGSTQMRGVDFSDSDGVFFGGDYGLAITVEGTALTAGNADFYNGYWARASLTD